MSKLSIIKPNKLEAEDTIGIISPAGPVENLDYFNNAIKYFESKGFKVQIAPNARNKESYLAGNDNERLNDLHNFFADPKIKAILCSRGGYGTMRFLDKLDYKLIKANPKIFVGYSDITALHSAIYKNTGLITFHGPLALSDFGTKDIDKYTEENFWNVLTKNFNDYEYKNPFMYECINHGEVESELTGGNLAVLCSLLGTPYFPDIKDKILLLEDIGEPIYKIDRMLTQLELAGVLNSISGLLVAKFTEIGDQEEILEKKCIDLINEKTKNLNIPIGYGFPASHHKTKATLPMNVEYEFNTSSNILRIK